MKIEKVKKETRTEKFPIPNIVKTMFYICKTDDSFPLKSEVSNIDQKIVLLEQKLLKKEKLLERSREISGDLERRISLLEDSISEQKIELLETLGSEI
jgi:hypothetical protein